MTGFNPDEYLARPDTLPQEWFQPGSTSNDPVADMEGMPKAMGLGAEAKPDTVVGNYSDRMPLLASLERGAQRLNQLGSGAIAQTAGRLPGRVGEAFRKPALEMISQAETRIQQIPPNEDRSPLGKWADIVAESLPVAAPTMAAAAATGGASLLPVAAATGAASGATEYAASVDDYLRQQGVDFRDAAQVDSAYRNPDLMAAARAYAAKRGAAVGALDALTLGVSAPVASALRAAGRPVGAAAAALGIEAAGGAAGEAAAQLASEGRITDLAAIKAEALGEILPGAAEVASARYGQNFNAGPAPGGVSPAASSGSPAGAGPAPSPSVAGLQNGTAPDSYPGGAGSTPAPATNSQPSAPAFDPDAYLAEVNATTPSPQPAGSVNTGDPNAFDPDAYLAQINASNRDPLAGTGFDPAQVRTAEVPLSDITLSRDVPNFKEDSRSDTGEVAGQELKGRYVRLGTPPIVVWERTDGRKEVITGRHRLALARRAGEASIPAQIVREADGFTRDMALIFDAESNIRDGQGSTRDYAHYFRNSGTTRLEAESRGLVQRAKGADGAALGYDATDDLYTLYRNRKLAEPKAVAIARAAPGDVALQQVASAEALRDPSLTAADLGNLVRAVKQAALQTGAPVQGDLFGRDDTAMKEMVATARAASRIQARIREKITTIRQGKKLSEGDRAALARELGITVTAADLDGTLATLEAEAQAWDNWQTNPDRVRAARQEAKLAVQPGPTAPANVGSSSSTLPPPAPAAPVPPSATPAQSPSASAGTAPDDKTATGLPQHALDAGIKSWEQAHKLGLVSVIEKALAIANEAVNASSNWIYGSLDSARNYLATEIVQATRVSGGLPTALRSLANTYNAKSNAGTERGQKERFKATAQALQKAASNGVQANPPSSAAAGTAPGGQQQLIGQDEGGFQLNNPPAPKPPPVDPAAAAKELEDARRRFREANSDSLFAPDGTIPQDLAPAPINSIPRDFDASAQPLVRFGRDTSTGQPVGTGDIIRYLREAFDVAIREGRMIGHGALGYYQTGRESIRLKESNTVPVAFHELGHYLHNVIFPGNPYQDARGTREEEYSQFGRQFDTELMPLGANTSTPSYTPHQVRMEGVAEFTRVYMTNRATAMALAPRFTAHFEAEIGKNAELAQAMETAREMVVRWSTQTPEERIAGQIRSSRDRFQTRSVREYLGNMARRVYTAWVDQTHPIAEALTRLTGMGGNPDQARAILGRIENYIGGWRGKVEDALHVASTDLDGNVVGRSLRKILDQVKIAAPANKLGPGQSCFEAFSNYVAAKHAQVDLHPRGIATGMMQSDIDAVVAKWDVHFRPLMQQLIDFQRQQRDLLVQAGIITRDAANAMDAKHAWYVPFHRFYEVVAGRDRSSSGQGFVNTPKGIQRMRGSRREIIDPLETIIANAYLFRDLAERNRIATAFVDYIDQTRGGGRVADPVARRMAPTEVRKQEILDILGDAGADPLLLAAVKQLGAEGQIWRAVDGIRPRDGIFRVWKDGEERFYQIDDPMLHRALILADQTDAEILARFPFLKAANWFTRLKRAGATLSPDFIVRNPIRDQFAAGLYAKDGAYIPFVDMFRGMFHVLKRDDIYNEWVRSGGRYAHMVGADKTNLHEALQDVIQDDSARAAFLAAANPLNIIQTLQRVSTLFEEATRVQYFANRRARGDTTMEAANASKEITLNFSRTGTSGKLFNMLSAFFNAGIQDFDKIRREHMDPAKAPGVMLRGFLYITIPSLLAWWAKESGDDEDRKILDGLPEWRKNLAWNFRVAGQTITIPKPFLLGMIYGSSVERALDYAQKRDPNAVRSWFDRTMSMLPAGGPGKKEGFFIPEGLIPDVLRIPLEGYSGYSLFRDAPIVPERLQGLPKEAQYDARTSQSAKAIGQAIGMSPMMVDHLLANTFAGLGRMTNDAIDFVVAKVAAEDAAAPVAKPWMETIPGIRAFVVPELSSQRQVEEIYKGYRNAEKLMRDGANRRPQQDKAWIERYGQDYRHYAAVMPSLRKAMDWMGDNTKAQRLVVESKTLTGDEKRARIVELNRARNDLARKIVESGMILPKDRYNER